jgi:hypothetical protein
MGWSTLRKATAEDVSRLETAARRFAVRHEIRVDEVPGDSPATFSVEMAMCDAGKGEYPWYEGGPRVARLWTACVRRALRNKHADGIAYGYVGHHCA